MTTIAALQARRLQHDWTWVELSADIKRLTGYHMSDRTLRNICKVGNGHLLDRTKFKLDQYEQAAAAEARSRNKRKPRRRATDRGQRSLA